MIHLNIHEAKTHLSKYLARLKEGETIVLCRRNKPIAEIRALPAARTKRRPMGLAAGMGHTTDDFNAPLPSDVLATFYGENEEK